MQRAAQCCEKRTKAHHLPLAHQVADKDDHARPLHCERDAPVVAARLLDARARDLPERDDREGGERAHHCVVVEAAVAQLHVPPPHRVAYEDASDLQALRAAERLLVLHAPNGREHRTQLRRLVQVGLKRIGRRVRLRIGLLLLMLHNEVEDVDLGLICSKLALALRHRKLVPALPHLAAATGGH
eukprot:1719193-Prymnesium_polylepis.1